MKKLAICIPTYNRREFFLRLLEQSVEQIKKSGYTDEIELCISDDNSEDDITNDVEAVRAENLGITIKYNRNKTNVGIWGNAKKIVEMADAEYCWIIGDDDVYACQEAVSIVIDKLYSELPDILTAPCIDFRDGRYENYNIFPYNTGDVTLNLTVKEDFDIWFNVGMCKRCFFTDPHQSVFRKSLWDKHVGNLLLPNDGYGFWIVLCTIALNGADVHYTNQHLIVSDRNETSHWMNKETIRRFSRDWITLHEHLVKLNESASNRFLELFSNWFIKNYPIIMDSPLLTDSQKQFVKNLDIEQIRLLNKLYTPPHRYRELDGKNIIFFGCGSWSEQARECLKNIGIVPRFYTDNDTSKHGKILNEIPIISPNESLEIPTSIYIITVKDQSLLLSASSGFLKSIFFSIYNQLRDMGIQENKICIPHILLENFICCDEGGQSK